jgi:non-ribosomal peptide synthetase component F
MINSMIEGGELLIHWHYSRHHYDQDTIEALSAGYLAVLQELIRHCKVQPSPLLTPSDYGLGNEISYKELDTFLDEQVSGHCRRDQVESLYRLSGLQEGMLFHSLYDSRSNAYIEQCSCDLLQVDIGLFTASWRLLLSRHSILRTGFYHDVFNIPVQCVYKEVGLVVRELDYRDKDEVTQQRLLSAYHDEDRSEGFDFKEVPLMRISLIRVEDTRYHMLWTSHHILFDGWSIPVLMEEFLTTYDLLSSGAAVVMGEADHYEDYIRYLESRDKEAEENYWRHYMRDVEGGSLLPFVTSSSDRNKGLGQYDTVVLSLDEEQSGLLDAYARQHHITVNAVMQGVWSYLLYRYTGNGHVTYGVAVSGRPEDLSNVERRVGMYINTIPLHVVVEEEMEVVSWLQSIQQEQLLSRKYQYAPLSDIQRWINIPGDLFDSILVFENFPVAKVLESDTWRLKTENVQMREETNYPLSVIVLTGVTFTIQFKYNTELLEDVVLQRIRAHFENVLMQLINNAALIKDLRLLTAKEEHTLLHTFNNTRREYPLDTTLKQLFEERVIADARAVAIISQGKSFTYQELNEYANQVAHYLIASGVKREELIPVLLDRSVEMIAVILGILKAGAAYIPVSADYPPERINYILEDAGAALVITALAHKERIITKQVKRIICIDEENSIREAAVTNTNMDISQEQLACVIYTSGSSGKPKGVQLINRSILNRCYWMWELYPFEKEEKTVLKTAFSFVDHIWELFGSLLKGVPAVLLAGEELFDLDLFLQQLSVQHVTRIILVPSLLQAILSKVEADNINLEHLKYWTCSGEALTSNLTEAFYILFPFSRLINIYGATEVTADVTYYDAATGQKEKLEEEELSLFELTFKDDITELIAEFGNREEIIKTRDEYTLPGTYYDVSGNSVLNTDEYTAFLRKELLPGIVNVSKPAYVGHMTSLVPAFVKDLSSLMIALNLNLVKTETSSLATSIERQVIGIVHRYVYKFKPSFYQQHVQNPDTCLGVITGGGTLSNITALSYALNKALGPINDFKGITEEGLVAALHYYNYKGVVMVGSRRMHYSIGKALRTLGLGRSACEFFDFDKQHPDESRLTLEEKLETFKKNGILVLALIGVAGATETGEVDPLKELGEIAGRHNIHYHIDGAFGGVYIFSSKLSGKLKGIEYADSMTLCGHKQMYLPLGASICLFKSPEMASYSENTTFYQARKHSNDLGRYSIEGSKGFISLLFHGALKVWGAGTRERCGLVSNHRTVWTAG